MTRERCIVIGAGSVGVNAALLLDRYGFDTVLLESADDILKGSAQVTFINHGDGFEYYKAGHRETGEYCVEGALTKALLYPTSRISTGVCSVSNPIRFLVSQKAVQADLVTKEGFLTNAAHMTRRHAKVHRAIVKSAGLSEEEVAQTLVYPPRDSISELNPDDYADVRGIVTGVHGNGFGVNMPHYYELVKAALRSSGVTTRFNTKVDRIRKVSEGEYEVAAGDHVWTGQHVLICAAHHIPDLAFKIEGEPLRNQFSGTFYLNSMTFLRLPATSDESQLRLTRKITFILMEEHGCMLAGVMPPTKNKEGLAAVYYPSPKGSQLDRHVLQRNKPSTPPAKWEKAIAEGLDESHDNVQTTFKYAVEQHPFLEGYAELSHTMCRTVFNLGVRGSNCGKDRRVRELGTNELHALTNDGRVSEWTGAKWTNAELTALQAVDYVRQRAGQERLARMSDADGGCGPEGLDVGTIIGKKNMVATDEAIRAVRDDTLAYASDAKLFGIVDLPL